MCVYVYVYVCIFSGVFFLFVVCVGWYGVASVCVCVCVCLCDCGCFCVAFVFVRWLGQVHESCLSLTPTVTTSTLKTSAAFLFKSSVLWAFGKILLWLLVAGCVYFVWLTKNRPEHVHVPVNPSVGARVLVLCLGF